MALAAKEDDLFHTAILPLTIYIIRYASKNPITQITVVPTIKLTYLYEASDLCSLLLPCQFLLNFFFNLL